MAGEFNTAVTASRHELVAFCAADDVWTPPKLEVQLDFMAARADVMFCHAHFVFITEPDWQPPPGFRPDLLGKPLPGPVPETMVARRRVFDEVGMFDLTLARVRRRLAGSGSGPLGALRDAADVLLEKRLHSANSFVTDENSRHLLEALRKSVERKRPNQPRSDRSAPS